MTNTVPRLINLMISTDPRGQGGVASVVTAMMADPFAQRWHIRLVPSHREGSKLLMLWLLIRALTLVLLYRMQGSPGIAHIHMASRGSFSRKYILAKWAKFLDFRVLVHLHGAQFDEFYLNECLPSKQRRIAELFNMADKTVVLGDKWFAWVKQTFPSVNKLQIVYNPGPRDLLERQPSINPTLLFLGRLGERKGVHDLIAALPTVLAEIPDLRVVLGGDGDASRFSQQALAAGVLGSIEFAGWIGKERKFQLLATCSAYVLPSYNEGFPVGIIEAMAAGIPIVASNVGGIPDAISDQQEGLLIPAGDVTALANAIIRVLSEQELACRLANNALVKFQREFSCGSIMPQWQQIYEDLLSDRRN